MNESTSRGYAEIDLLLYCSIIKKRRKFIGAFVTAAVIIMLIISLFLTNIYKANAVIMPVTSADAGSIGIAATMMQQIGGLPGVSAIETASSGEIVALLNSNILREKIITQYNLLPVLFPDEWDWKAKTWKINAGFTVNPRVLAARFARWIMPADEKKNVNDNGVPTVWDGLRRMDDTVAIISNVKEKTITITAESENPILAAQIAGYFLSALNDHMSREAKRVAMTNRKYLGEQLTQTTDPFIKQKIYNLIAQQIETSMMAEVKENFAFKIIDPPKVPDKKFKPRRMLLVMISLTASLIISIFWVFFSAYLDRLKVHNGAKE